MIVGPNPIEESVGSYYYFYFSIVEKWINEQAFDWDMLSDVAKAKNVGILVASILVILGIVHYLRDTWLEFRAKRGLQNINVRMTSVDGRDDQ
jgi:hypothetical protein